ncbi:hypothetical protein BH18THE2_BH18THE2_09130 [soil metagenome]
MSSTRILPNDELHDIDDEEFGLTDEEYQFLMEDIDRVVAEANKKWDYSHVHIEPETKKDKPSVESVMIARGLIKTRHVPNNNNNRKPAIIELENIQVTTTTQEAKN